MDLTQLANLGEFIGGIAVLVTLVYLALQVRSTQRQLNDQSLTSVFQTLYDAYQPFFMGENRDLIHAGLMQERELSPSEATVFNIAMARVFCSVIPMERADPAAQEACFPIVAYLIDEFPGGAAWARDARGTAAFVPSFAAFDRLSHRFGAGAR